MSRVVYIAERVSDRLSKRELWRRWRAAGACGDCGEPIKRFARCVECRRKHAAWNLAWWHRRKAKAA